MPKKILLIYGMLKTSKQIKLSVVKTNQIHKYKERVSLNASLNPAAR